MSGRPCVLLLLIALVVTGCGRLEPVEPELAASLPEPTPVSESTPVPTTEPVDSPTAAPELPTPIEVPSPTTDSVDAQTPEPTAEAAEAAEVAATATPTESPAASESPTTAPTLAPAPITPAPTAPVAPTAIPTATDQLVAVANGAEVYSINCARCHSESGLGTFQASGLIGINRNWNAASLAVELTDGHPVTFGFGHTLSPDEIAAVVAYVLATF